MISLSSIRVTSHVKNLLLNSYFTGAAHAPVNRSILLFSQWTTSLLSPRVWAPTTKLYSVKKLIRLQILFSQ